MESSLVYNHNIIIVLFFLNSNRPQLMIEKRRISHFLENFHL